MIDPIEDIVKLAKQMMLNVCFHVDACVGGFILPFLDMENIDLP